MKITIVTRVFPPEQGSTSRIIYQIAEYMKYNGHEITVIANYPNRPGGQIFDGFKRKLYDDCIINGIKLYRTWHTFSKRSNLISRGLENFSLGITSSFLLRRLPKPDLVYILTWPIFATKMVVKVCKSKNVPYINHVMDMYPETLISMNILKDTNLLTTWLKNIDTNIVAKSSKTIVLANFMKDKYVIDRGISSDKIEIVYNWAVDVNEINTIEKEKVLNKYSDVELNKFVVMYAGSIGYAQGLEIMIDAAKLHSFNKNVMYLIVGNGSYVNNLRNRIKSLRLNNIKVITNASKRELYILQSTFANILLLSLRNHISNIAFPSKLSYYMSSKKPIIAAIDQTSEIANIIKSSNCGWVINSFDCKSLVQIIENNHKHITSLNEMGENSFKFFVNNFDQDVSLRKILNLVNDI